MKMFRFLKKLLLLAIALYSAVLAYYVIFQRHYIYFPMPDYVGPKENTDTSSFEELQVTTEDHLPLTGWYAPASGRPFTIVFFHGSGDSLYNVAPVALPYLYAGYGFLLGEYRGYSGMPGSPSENGLYADARAYVAKLFDMGVDVDHMIFMGHSIGAAVATQMAREFHPAGLVLLAPFASLVQRAGELYPIFPTNYVVWDHFANDEKVGQLDKPIFILHGDSDTTIPLAHGQKLHDLAQEPKSFQLLKGVGHNDMLEPATPYVLDWLRIFQKR